MGSTLESSSADSQSSVSVVVSPAVDTFSAATSNTAAPEQRSALDALPDTPAPISAPRI